MRLIAKIIIAAIASLLVIGVLVVGLVWAALFEPWPISIHQGPDTTYAKTLYSRLLGSDVPHSVRDLYGRDEWGFGGDSIYSLRFRFEDPKIVAEIVAGPMWKRVRPEQFGRLRYLAGPKWWPPKEKLLGFPEVYANRNIELLWVDRDNNQAYFQRAFCCVLMEPPPVP